MKLYEDTVGFTVHNIVKEQISVHIFSDIYGQLFGKLYNQLGILKRNLIEDVTGRGE